MSDACDSCERLFHPVRPYDSREVYRVFTEDVKERLASDGFLSAEVHSAGYHSTESDRETHNFIITTANERNTRNAFEFLRGLFSENNYVTIDFTPASGAMSDKFSQEYGAHIKVSVSAQRRLNPPIIPVYVDGAAAYEEE